MFLFLPTFCSCGSRKGSKKIAHYKGERFYDRYLNNSLHSDQIIFTPNQRFVKKKLLHAAIAAIVLYFMAEIEAVLRFQLLQGRTFCDRIG
jgi:hypothetical protein